MAALDVVVGRQPVFDRDLTVMGYELLFQQDEEGSTDGEPSSDFQAASVVFGAMSVGLAELVGNKTIFCRASRAELVGSSPVFLPPERTVLGVAADVVVDDVLVRGCRELVREGYDLALDDFASPDGAERLFELASVAKLDVHRVGPQDLSDLIARCRGLDLRLVAKNVESTEQLEACSDLGFDFFQGYLLARPQVVSGRTLDTSTLSRVRLAMKLVAGECDFDEIEDIVRVDPSTTYRLLQLAGLGAEGGLRRDVRSLRDALVLAGWRRLQSWLAYLLLTGHGTTSEEEIVSSLTRARMAELLASRLGADRAAQAFTAGMLSTFDLLLKQPLEEVLNALPLDPDLRAAALGGDTELGRVVADVVDYQVGRRSHAWRCRLDLRSMHHAGLEALTWAIEAASRAAPWAQSPAASKGELLGGPRRRVAP